MHPDTAYGLSLLAALLMGGGCLLFAWRRAGHGLGAALRALGLALLCSLVGARLFYFLARFDHLLPMYGWGRLLLPPPGEMAFGGAVLGLLLAGWLLARGGGRTVHHWLDMMTPAALVFLFIARLGEYFVAFGQGAYVAQPHFQFFPLAVSNQWGEWYWAVFMLEALFALLILLLSRRPGREGALWQRALMLLLLGQILCDSLRADTLRWGFVKVHQLFSALGLAALLLYYLRGLGRGRLITAGLYLLGIALIIGIEFALDKWLQMPNAVLYAVMCLVLFAMGWLISRAARLASLPLFGGIQDGQG